MGKTRVIAETGAGQHGVATATACALTGLECTVYMGEEDIRRQKLNVFNMRTIGAKVVPVTTGSRTLRDATNEAMRDWMGSSAQTHYTIGSVVGPHPFPMIVRDFQSVIGKEARQQCLDRIGRLPDAIVACVGGGSNAAGMFYPFIGDESVEMIGAEAGGRNSTLGQHASSLTKGLPGVLHGSFSYVLQDDEGQTSDVHSISAGLDYPGVGPEHSYWKDIGRVRYEAITDAEATGGVQHPGPSGRNSARVGVEPRHLSGHEGSRPARPRQGRRHLPLRPRGQGRLRDRPHPRRTDGLTLILVSVVVKS